VKGLPKGKVTFLEYNFANSGMNGLNNSTS
jgi:hypothetical protein